MTLTTRKKHKNIAISLLGLSLVLLMVPNEPASATVTSYTKNPSYQATSSWGIDSTGASASCSPGDLTANWDIYVCWSSSTSGTGHISGEADEFNPALPTNISGAGKFDENNAGGQTPVTANLSSQYVVLTAQVSYDGDLYMSNPSYSDGYVVTYLNTYRDPLANGNWQSYNGQEVYVFHAQQSGQVYNLNVSNYDEYTTPVFGPTSGKFSMLVENDAVGVATNDNVGAYADFYTSPYNITVNNMVIYQCDTQTECSVET